jgi:LPXTG-motif cell wall-anchored protein
MTPMNNRRATTPFLLLAAAIAATPPDHADAGVPNGCFQDSFVVAAIDFEDTTSGSGSGSVTADGTTIAYTYSLGVPEDSVTFSGNVTSGGLSVIAAGVDFTGGDGEPLSQDSSVSPPGTTFSVVLSAPLTASGSRYTGLSIFLANCSGVAITTSTTTTTVAAQPTVVVAALPTTSVQEARAAAVLPATGRNLSTAILAALVMIVGSGLLIAARRPRRVS